MAVDARSARVLLANRFDNSVSVLDARSGRLVRTVAVGGLPGALAVAVHRARIVITNSGDGSVSLLDAEQGALLRTVYVGARPGAVAVDGRDLSHV